MTNSQFSILSSQFPDGRAHDPRVARTNAEGSPILCGSPKALPASLLEDDGLVEVAVAKEGFAVEAPAVGEAVVDLGGEVFGGF